MPNHWICFHHSPQTQVRSRNPLSMMAHLRAQGSLDVSWRRWCTAKTPSCMTPSCYSDRLSPLTELSGIMTRDGQSDHETTSEGSRYQMGFSGKRLDSCRRTTLGRKDNYIWGHSAKTHFICAAFINIVMKLCVASVHWATCTHCPAERQGQRQRLDEETQGYNDGHFRWKCK